jgi:hypothetical protein
MLLEFWNSLNGQSKPYFLVLVFGIASLLVAVKTDIWNVYWKAPVTKKQKWGYAIVAMLQLAFFGLMFLGLKGKL